MCEHETVSSRWGAFESFGCGPIMQYGSSAHFNQVLCRLDNTAVGHRAILENFGPSALPNVTWQIGKRGMLKKEQPKKLNIAGLYII